MSAPGPSSMKSLQKRLCTVLPRVASSSSQTASSPSRIRSNSASRSFYTASSSFSVVEPAPPRSNSISPPNSRIAIEAKSELEGGTHGHGHPQSQLNHPSNSLALTSPQSNFNSSTFLLSTHHTLSSYPPYNVLPSASLPLGLDVDPAAVSLSLAKKRKLRYQFDVGAYGIPKRCRPPDRINGNGAGRPLSSLDRELQLSVQVGEDAYFVREDAMGIADGVGGWSRVKHPTSSPNSTSPTPSALFSRRLMHYCSSEVAGTHTSTPCRPISIPQSTRSRPYLHYPQPRRQAPPSANNPIYTSEPGFDHEPSSVLEDELEDSLSDLEDGIDILMILERAYTQTLKAHVSPPSSTPLVSSPAPAVFAPFIRSSPDPAPPVALKTGSSTALLAILDQCTSTSPACSPSGQDEIETVVKIAHVGDCMGMLVRAEEIIWRSEEMWWDFNTPVQLGPTPTSALPSDAQVFSFSVQADDILILASDGLSDNLWDEDILDEVVRFRRSFLTTRSSSSTSACDASQTSDALLQRRTLAGMLSEALCSRARTVAERRPKSGKEDRVEDEVPFARRAREHGKPFKGGKNDDISVIVAVISPTSS